MGTARTDDDSGYATRVAAAFNGVAEARRANCRPPEFFASGGSVLEPDEAEAVGDPTGRRLLQLQCSGGDEALSWSVLGADVTGVDISETAIGIAAAQAADAGIPVDFRVADVLRLPSDLQRADFDIVHSSAGIVCWISDLARWAETIERALAPGGAFVLNEHHPIWEVLVVQPEGVQVTVDYFGRSERPVPPSGLHSSKRASAGGVALDLDAETFLWPLGDVITALASAGLRIQRLVERSELDGYLRDATEPTSAQRQAAERLPMSYLLVARKPDR